MKQAELKIYTNNEFIGHYPVGTAAVVVATSAKEAAKILSKALREEHLYPAEAKDMILLPYINGTCRVLCNGDY